MLTRSARPPATSPFLSFKTRRGARAAWSGWMAPSTPAAASSAGFAAFLTASTWEPTSAAQLPSLRPMCRAASRAKPLASNTRAAAVSVPVRGGEARERCDVTFSLTRASLLAVVLTPPVQRACMPYFLFWGAGPSLGKAVLRGGQGDLSAPGIWA